MGQFHLRVHIFKSETGLAEFLMKENVGPFQSEIYCGNQKSQLLILYILTTYKSYFYTFSTLLLPYKIIKKKSYSDRVLLFNLP